MDRNFVNVILLGIAFMLIFTAFQTGGMIQVCLSSLYVCSLSFTFNYVMQQTVVDSIHLEDPTYTANGYTSLCIIYAAFALANWIAPSTVIITGPKLAMVFGGVTYWYDSYHRFFNQIIN